MSSLLYFKKITLMNLQIQEALNTIGNIILRSNENLEWALELFKINVQLYPDDGNLWDSLGDGYKSK